MPFPIVVLDANVLVPAAPRDTLLRAAEAGLYQARWSAEILEEVERTLISRALTSRNDARDLIATLKEAFPDAMVSGHRPLIRAMRNSPEDRHVLAAAVRAHAEVIVTENLADFPSDSLSGLGVAAQTIDAFPTRLESIAPRTMRRILREQVADLQAPSMTLEELSDILMRWAPEFIEQMRR